MCMQEDIRWMAFLLVHLLVLLLVLLLVPLLVLLLVLSSVGPFVTCFAGPTHTTSLQQCYLF